VTVYTQFGYASVDLNTYKDDLSASRSNSSSPDKVSREESEKKEIKGGGGMNNHELDLSLTSSMSLHDKIIEV
jgi:hypothetical protein